MKQLINFYSIFDAKFHFLTKMVEECDTLLFKTLPFDMMEEIKIRFILSFHKGFWSVWLYRKVSETLIVDVGKLHVNDNDGV